MKNEFDKETKYGLFRSVQEILHPTISKKNISDYKIIIEEDILPVRIFYPQKVSNLSKVILYVHGNGKVTGCHEKYSDICKSFTKNTGCLVIAIEYMEEKNAYRDVCQKIYDTVKYLYERLERDNIDSKNIILMGDSTGASIIMSINYYNHGEISIEKEILFYPVLSPGYADWKKYPSFQNNLGFNLHLLEELSEYFDFIATEEEQSSLLLNPLLQERQELPSILLFEGLVDCLRDEVREYKDLYSDKIQYEELAFASHGFLKKMDLELASEVFQKVNDFIE